MSAEAGDQTLHFVFVNSRCIRPLSETDAPEFPWSAWVPGRQDDVEMSHAVSEHKAVDVFRAGHVLQRPCQAIDQLTQSGGFRVREVAQSPGVPFGLGDEIAPICHRRSGPRIGMSGIDEIVLEENAAQRAFAQRMFGADKAVRSWCLIGHTQSIPRKSIAGSDPVVLTGLGQVPKAKPRADPGPTSCPQCPSPTLPAT